MDIRLVLCVAMFLCDLVSTKTLFFRDNIPPNLDSEGHYVFTMKDSFMRSLAKKLKEESNIPSFSPIHDEISIGDINANFDSLNQPNDDEEKESFDHSRIKRSTDSLPDSPLKKNVTKYILNDPLRQMIIHWAGKGNASIIVLTKNAGAEDIASKSNVYFSYDYGQKFTKINMSGIISKFYHSPSDINAYIFVDYAAKKLYTTRDMGSTIRVSNCPFVPSYINIHPVDSYQVIGYDKESSNRSLWYSSDFGDTWERIQLNIRDVHWGYTNGGSYDNPNTLYVERLEPSGKVSILRTETYFKHDSKEEVLVSNVEDFAIRNDSLFATRRGRIYGDNELLLAITRHSPFVAASFPTKLAKKEFFIIDAADGQIMVLVAHKFGRTDLYISEPNRIDFSFSLANVTYFNPEGVGASQSFLVNRDDRFADIHKVKGLRTIFIANTAKIAKGGQYDMSSMKTYITFDKGGIWEAVPPPRSEINGSLMCEDSSCSLHLAQEFHHAHASALSSLIMTASSAPGYILAMGNIGDNIKGHRDLFFSPNGGKDWREIRKGVWYYTWADHGGIIGIVPKVKKTKELLYSIDEGKSWKSIIFYDEEISVFGLMTEPGETTTIFTVFGATNDASNSWVIIQVDLLHAFTQQCSAWQYRTWSPEDENGMSCLLGAKMTFRRKSTYDPSSCYNGRNFDRPTNIVSCRCTRLDFECSEGFYIAPNSHSLTCKQDPNSDYDPYQIPPNCRSGSTYKRTKGYQRIPGDICVGGSADEHYGPVDALCPVIEEDAFLLITSSSGITRLDLSNEKYEILNLGIEYASGIKNIDFEYSSNCIYYAQGSKIERVCMDGTLYDNKTIISESQTISSMVIDWDSKNIYWAVESTPPKIKVMNLKSDLKADHRFTRILDVNASLVHKPISMAVYPRKGYLFYSDVDTDRYNSHIIRANLDGTNATTISHDYSLRWYSSLTVDEASDRLYFISKGSYFSKVASVDIDGLNQISILYDAEVRSVVTFKSYMYYWRDPGDLQRGDKFGYSSNHSVAFNLKDVGTIKVVRRGLQVYPNKCGNKTSNCPQLCIPISSGKKDIDAIDQCYCDNVKYTSGKKGGKECSCRTNEVVTSSGQCEPNKTTCNTNEFRCNDGRCIPSSWRCDHGKDCADESDEKDCPYNECQVNTTRCGTSSYCIHNKWLCDGQKDCADGSDELNCPENLCNSTTQFTCANNQCINKGYKCDGDYDCDDKSDELNCGEASECNSDLSFKCVTVLYGGRCVPNSWRCDGERDCEDGSDETGCANNTCSEYQFGCGDGKCIFNFWRCDGENDCDNGADEKNCPASTVHPTTTTSLPFSHGSCLSTEFLCHNHPNCIPLQWKCDGTNDCGDHSDEFDCAPPTTGNSSTGAHTCFNSIFQYNCDNGLCILAFFECDGDNDCGDWSDEKHCKNFPDHHNHPGCFSGNGFDYTGIRNYTKSGRTCQKWSKNTPHKPHYWPVDRDNNYCRNPDNDGYGPWCYTTDPEVRWEYCGIPHCSNSTRPNVPYPTPVPNDCQDGYYSCGHGKCIPDKWVCDEEDDCGNDADEDWCNFKCDAASEMMCKNDRCVLKSEKCNGINDCGDNSDETACSTTVAPTTCDPATQFRCLDDGKCIPKKLRCNYMYDCRDSSDEYNCTYTGTTISPPLTNPMMTQCINSNKYIHNDQICDYNIDCPEASDEKYCSAHIVKFTTATDCSNTDSACERLQWETPKTPVPAKYSNAAKYMIYYSETFISPQDDKRIKALPAISSKITEIHANLGGLKWQQKYYAYIRISINEVVLPSQQDSSITFTTSPGKPGVPTNVEAMDERRASSGLFYIIFSWNKPAITGIGSDQINTWYAKVTDQHNKSSTYRMYVDDCQRCQSHLSLKRGKVSIQVLANNIYYNGTWSEPLKLCVGCIDKPKLTAVPHGSYGCNISWTINNPMNMAISNFSIKVESDGLVEDRRLTATADKTWKIINRLQPKTRYDISLAVWTSDSMSTYSDYASITLDGQVPVILAITGVTPNSTNAFVVNWKVTKGKAPAGALYEVSWNEEDIRDPSKITKVSKYTTLVQNLPSNVVQIFKVRLIQPYISAYSMPKSGVPLYDYREKPRNLEAAARPDHVTGFVNWTRPTDGGIVPLSYILQVTDLSTNKVIKTLIVNETKQMGYVNQVITSLVPGTHYNVSVRINSPGSHVACTTFYVGTVPGPIIEKVEPLGSDITDYAVVFSIDPAFRNFYDVHAKKIQCWVCNGTNEKTPTNDSVCIEKPDVDNDANILELRELVANKSYRIFLGARCDSIHECGFSHYDLFVDGKRHIVIDTMPTPSANSFPLTTKNIIAVAVPIIAVVLVLVGIIVYLQIRRKRLSAAYRGFVASHYDPQSGEAIFVSNDDDEDRGLALDDDDNAETPLITGFADDEPLIVA